MKKRFAERSHREVEAFCGCQEQLRSRRLWEVQVIKLLDASAGLPACARCEYLLEKVKFSAFRGQGSLKASPPLSSLAALRRIQSS